MGMASALETLCRQADGAQQYQQLGTQTYTVIFSLISARLPLSITWIYKGKILIFRGQNSLISQEAGKCTMWLVPVLFAYAILQPLLWLGSLRGTLAIGVSYWLNVTLLVLHVKYSSSCAKTSNPIYLEVLRGVGKLFNFAIPSAVMICLNTLSMLYTIPLEFGASMSWEPQGSWFAVDVVLCLAVIVAPVVAYPSSWIAYKASFQAAKARKRLFEERFLANKD